MSSAYRVTVVVLVLGVAMLAPASGQARKRHRTCYPAHTKTLVASARARVFRTRRVVQDAHVTYGCLLSRKRPFRFYLPDFPSGFDPIVLAGRYVAYGDYSDCAASFCDPNSVILQNLRNGHITFADGPGIRIANVSALVLKRDGSVAWIASTFDEFGALQPGRQVVKVERGAGPVVLDSGTGVVADSLALAGSTLYWTKNGAPFSASLR
jgi:hypothetical protein